MARRGQDLLRLPAAWVSAMVDAHETERLVRSKRPLPADSRERRITDSANEAAAEMGDRIRRALAPECEERDLLGISRTSFARHVERELMLSLGKVGRRRPVHRALLDMQQEARRVIEEDRG